MAGRQNYDYEEDWGKKRPHRTVADNNDKNYCDGCGEQIRPGRTCPNCGFKDDDNKGKKW